MNKKSFTEHMGDFIAGKGFYIVLFLCVAAIGISGYYLFHSLGTGTKNVAVDAPAQVVVTPSPPVVATPPVVKPTTPPPPVETPESEATPDPEPEPEPEPEVKPSPSQSALSSPVFTWPIKGDIIGDFSLEVLAYDETMGDWRTHNGVDISAEVGTEVCSISSGTVETVFHDDLMGTTVVIDHGGGVKSFYSNLASAPTVSAGDKVDIHAVIGSVGTTSLCESSKPAHLHLEITKDDLAVDPMQFLP